MKNKKALTNEHFFLYWNGHKQPAGTTANEIVQYISDSLDCTKIEKYKIASNFRESITFEQLQKEINN